MLRSHQGETILDLGSGGGFDIFLAAKQLGKTGRAIGIDMNADMIALANRNAQKSPHAPQIEFLHSKITSIPAVPSGSVDCVISNCVINLVPDSEKPDVFRECARLLKPGGRVAVSDILAKKELPDSIRNDAGMLVGCIAGASRVYEYEGWLRESGFADVVVVDTGKDINVYKDAKEGCCGAVPDKKESTTTGGGCCAPKKTKTETAEGEKKEVEVDYDLNEWVGELCPSLFGCFVFTGNWLIIHRILPDLCDQGWEDCMRL